MRCCIPAGVLIIAVAFEGVGSAQTSHVDTLHINARADRMATAAGGEAGMQWVRTIGEKGGVHIGGASGSVARSWWLSGEFGGHRRFRAVTASGAAQMGQAADASGRFRYGRYKAGVGIPVLPGVVVEAEAQFVSMPKTLSQRVYRSSASWTGWRSATLQGSYHRLSSETAASNMVSGRIDVTAGRIGWIGGVMVGSSRALDPLEAQLSLTPPSREVFGGCRLRLRDYELSTVVDWSQSVISVARVLVGIRVPLK